MALKSYSFTSRVAAAKASPQDRGKNPTNKILICLLFWDGDREMAMKLARLLADLENQHSDLADFLFVARFDSRHDNDTVSYVSRKFNVFTHTSKHKEQGWPAGCNGLIAGATEFIYHKMANGKIPNYKAVFNIAADSGPLKRDWLPILSNAWDSTNKNNRVYVAGPFLQNHDQRDHINGDSILFSGDLKFQKWLLSALSRCRGAGWDWALAGEFNRWGWENFPFILSHWRRPSMSFAEWDELYRQGVVWLHGVRSNDLLDISRHNLV